MWGYVESAWDTGRVTEPHLGLDSPPPPDSWPGADGRRSIAPEVPSWPGAALHNSGDSWPGARRPQPSRTARTSREGAAPQPFGIGLILYLTLAMVVELALLALWVFLRPEDSSAQAVLFAVLLLQGAASLGYVTYRYRRSR